MHSDTNLRVCASDNDTLSLKLTVTMARGVCLLMVITAGHLTRKRESRLLYRCDGMDKHTGARMRCLREPGVVHNRWRLRSWLESCVRGNPTSLSLFSSHPHSQHLCGLSLSQAAFIEVSDAIKPTQLIADPITSLVWVRTDGERLQIGSIHW